MKITNRKKNQTHTQNTHVTASVQVASACKKMVLVLNVYDAPYLSLSLQRTTSIFSVLLFVLFFFHEIWEFNRKKFKWYYEERCFNDSMCAINVKWMLAFITKNVYNADWLNMLMACVCEGNYVFHFTF